MAVTFVEPRTDEHPAWVQAVVDLHLRWFADYAYAEPELRDNGVLPARRGDRVVHQVLALVDGKPAGYVIVHTNLRRRVGVIHFLAVEPDFRDVEVGGLRLAHGLVEHARHLVGADAGHLGLPSMLGVGAEAEESLVPIWEHWGFGRLPIDYHEPHYGVRWPEHGEPTFFDRTLVAAPLSDHPFEPEACARALAAAFLLDHYQLPADHPEVAWLTA